MAEKEDVGSAVPEAGQRAADRSAGNADRGPRRFSARRKTEAVLRLLRGEDLELLSRELGVEASRLSGWRDRFLAGGQESIKKHPANGRDKEISQLREKLGATLMDNELLQEKIRRIEGNRPLGRRRPRR